MAKIKVIGGRTPETINPLLTENEFPNSSTLFNISNFKVTTNLRNRNVRDFSNELSVFSQPITLETLKINDINISKNITSLNNKLELNYDKSNLYNYAQYGSLLERLRAAIENIIKEFPGSLFITNTDENGQRFNNIINYNFDNQTNTSTFTIPAFLIQNVFNLNYSTNSSIIFENNDLKNLIFSFDKYELFIPSNDDKYDILSFVGSFNNLSSIILTVKGNPFPIASSASTDSILFHIKPKDQIFNTFYKNLPQLERQILNIETTPKYTLTVKIPVVSDDDELYWSTENYTFPILDGYNIDIITTSFSDYYDSLLRLGEVYDSFKSDIIYRMYMPPSVKDTDITDSKKSQLFSRILGRELDEVKNFIDGLTYVNRLSYDKTENIPDLLVKNLAKTLGWDDFNIIEVDDLFASIFNTATEDTPVNATASELDIELWRRILINTNYLFKSKGTRKAIEAIFSFIGVPDCLIELNEYIYTVSGKINPDTVDLTIIFPLNEQFTRLPYDSQGYPIAPNEINTFYFQKAGNSDSGQEYIDLYRTLGFNVTKTIDNKKSWVYTEKFETRYDDFTTKATLYDIEDSRLIINSKEISIMLDPIQAIECDVYAYNFNNNYPVSDNIRSFPYPTLKSNNFTVSGMTFIEYIEDVYSNFINVQNRKIVDDARGGGYPSLTKLYYDYLYRSLIENGIQSNAYSISKIFRYIKNFQSYFTKFFDQLLPATTIIAENGIKIRNTVFTPQKFVYKAGIDAGSEFATKLPENPIGKLKNIGIKKSTINLPFKSDIKIWESSAEYTYSSNSDTGNSNSPFLRVSKTLKPKDRWSSDIFVFTKANYNIQNAENPCIHLPNQNSVYFFDQTNINKLITFEFDNIECLSSTTNNCQFIYKVYEYNNLTSGFTIPSIYEFTIPTSAFIQNNILQAIPRFVLSPDTEYLIRGGFIKNIPIPSADTLEFRTSLDSYGFYDRFIYPSFENDYNFFFDYTKYSGYTGTTITSFDETTDINGNLTNICNDGYFPSVADPIPTQIINLDNPTLTPTCAVYYYEQLIPNQQLEVVLSFPPNGDVQFIVNGSTILNNTEYILKTNVISELENRVYILNVSFNNDTDILTVAYLANGNSYDIVNDFELIETIPSGTTEQPPNKILFNNLDNRFEFFLSQNVSGNTNNIQVTWNGLSLTPFNDYVLSSINPRRIIFPNIQISTGDTISVYYTTNDISVNQTFILDSNPFLFEWQTNTPIINQIGSFYIEFSNENDNMFTGSTFISETVAYSNFLDYFNLNIDFTQAPYNVLQLGSVYNIRIVSNKLFNTITDDTIVTTGFSPTIRVRLPF